MRRIFHVVPVAPEGGSKMLRAAMKLRGSTVAATNGDLGIVDDLFFDDWSWTIRYLIVDTRGWLSGRRVLISPLSAVAPEWRRLNVALTREQVAQCPQVDVTIPVSRQQEAELARHYGHPCYWVDPSRRGPIPQPPLATAPTLPPGPVEQESRTRRQEAANPHLRSVRGMTGCYVEAMDGDLGHIEDVLVDGRAWAIRYVIVDTRNWWPGKKVLVAPDWIRTVSWPKSRVFVDLTRDRIRQAPAYDPMRPLDRILEARLYGHYGRPPYWEAEERIPAASPVAAGTGPPQGEPPQRATH